MIIVDVEGKKSIHSAHSNLTGVSLVRIYVSPDDLLDKEIDTRGVIAMLLSRLTPEGDIVIKPDLKNEERLMEYER